MRVQKLSFCVIPKRSRKGELIEAGLVVPPAEIAQLEKMQMELAAMPPEPEPVEEEPTMDPKDYKKGDI